MALVPVACSSAQESDIGPLVDASLVYVEAVRARDGLLAGRFGDIILLDGSTGQTRRLTDDSYYDASPTWSPDCRQILFESKRDPRISRIAGLGEPSKLYLLDVSSGHVEKYGLDSLLEARLEDGTRFQEPAWSNSGNNVVFLTNEGWKLIPVILRLEDTSLTHIDPGLKTHAHFHWSHEGDVLVFDFRPSNAVVSAIGIYDLSNKSYQIITRNLEEGRLYGAGATTCDAGNWLPTEPTFFYSCSFLGNNSSSIYRYNLNDKKPMLVAKIPEVQTSSPLYVDNKLFFIGYKINGEDYDIWMYDLRSKQLKRITSNGKAKEGLAVCKSK